MKAVVVGGGIVGLFTAYFLQAEGVKVTLVERGELGEWSKAAAGILEYTRFVINRINVKSYPARYLAMVIRGDARIKTWDRRWLAAYLKSLGREPTSDMWGAVRHLGDFSRRHYRAMAEEKNDFQYSEEPLYELWQDAEAALEEAKRDPLAPRVEVVECCGREAVAYLDAAKLSTEDFIDRMKRELSVEVARGEAVEILPNAVRLEGGKTLHGDVVVVAAGWWARRLGLPVAPLKGYGFRTTARAGKMFIDMSRGVAVVPLAKWTKITGRFDLDATTDHKPAGRVLKAAESLVGQFQVIDMAVGYRPCTPDGFPIVDKVGELVVVTGACRLGWTYGPALGKAAADLALGRTAVALPAGRFGG